MSRKCPRQQTQTFLLLVVKQKCRKVSGSYSEEDEEEQEEEEDDLLSASCSLHVLSRFSSRVFVATCIMSECSVCAAAVLGAGPVETPDWPLGLGAGGGPGGYECSAPPKPPKPPRGAQIPPAGESDQQPAGLQPSLNHPLLLSGWFLPRRLTHTNWNVARKNPQQGD